MKTIEKTAVEVLKALADETRLRILRLLDQEELNVNEIREVLGMSQSRVSRHLAVLREAGLIRDRREGNWIFYSLENEGDGEPELLRALRKEWMAIASFEADRRGLTRILRQRAEDSRKHFDESGESWESFSDRHFDPMLNTVALVRLLGHYRLLVDIGTGSGAFLPLLASRADRVVAVDHSKTMLRRAMSRAQEEGLKNVEFREGSLDELPLEDEIADGMFVNFVLHHAPRPALALSEMYRSLKPGGRAVVMDFLPHAEEWLREEHGDLRLGLAPEAVGQWFDQAGFEAYDIEDWAFCRDLEKPNGIENLRVFIASGMKPVS